MASLTINGRLALVGPVAACLVLALTPVAAQASSPPSTPPSVKTGGDRVVGTLDTLEGTVNPNGLATTYWFEYGPNNKWTEDSKTAHLQLSSERELSEINPVSQSVTGMQANWRYRLVAENSADAGKPEAGSEKIFMVKATKKKGASKSAFTLRPPSEPTPVGEPFVLGGTLTGTGNAGREVVLQASPYPYRAAFADVGAPVPTSLSGDFSFVVPHFSTNTHFRVATVGGSSLVSKVITGLAAVHVVLKVRTSSVRKGLVRLYGTVSPAEVGAHVFFQLEKPAKQKLPSGKPEKAGKPEKEETEKPPTFSTKFSTVAKRATRTMSRFSIIVSVQDAGEYRAFVSLAPGPLASGHSGNHSLAAGSTKRNKK